MSEKRIIDWSDYIYGRVFLENDSTSKAVYRLTEEFVADMLQEAVKHPTLKQNLTLTNSATEFYVAEPDFAQVVPNKAKEEVFYALKLGKYSPTCPAQLLYLVETVGASYWSMNLFTKVVPAATLKRIFSPGYFEEDYCLRDVICSIYGEEFEPLSIGKLCVPSVGCADMFDIYIEEKDMVAKVPKAIAERLTNVDIQKLVVDGRKIKLESAPITELGGYLGAVNSTYDLTITV